MNIGRKIYFEKANGVIVWDKGEMSGSVTETTLDQDKVAMPILNTLDLKGQLGVLQLNYGDFSTNFQSCKCYYINVTDNTIIFL